MFNWETDKRGGVDRKATLDREFTRASSDGLRTWEVVKSTLRGSTYYAAVRTVDAARGTVETWALVALTSITGSGTWEKMFNYKEMSEDMGPYYYDCPASILDLLDETASETANKWRAACREKAAKLKAARKNPDSLKNLPVGSVIRFTCEYNMSGGTKAGDQVTLQKVKRYNGRTYWSDGYYRWNEKTINEVYEILSRGEEAAA